MKLSLALYLLLLPGLLWAQNIEYEVSFDNRVHHEAEIRMKVSQVPRGPLIVKMSQSSAGRYALHQFAKNVYNVRAFDKNNRPIAIQRLSSTQWNIPEHSGELQVVYTLFGDHADGTYNSIDHSHAHLNIPAAFLWPQGMEKRPVNLRFVIPPGSNWKVATQLRAESDGSYFAPDHYYFMDSPVEIADLQLREWQIVANGKTQTMRLALHHPGQEALADQYADMIKKIVAEEIAVFGELPAFDFGSYTFLACYMPHAKDDGMEHRNSTMLSSAYLLPAGNTDNLSTVAHELFHAWNVERLRPKSLEPFDFSRENISGELWFAEGFTTYYGHLIMARAGLYTPAQFSETMQYFIDRASNSPAWQMHSAVEMSQRAPFADAAVAIDPANSENAYLSYYTHGCVLGLALDLALRLQFKDLSLDSYMKILWDKYGKREMPYTLADLQQSLAELCKDKKFADEWFQKYIYGKQMPDFKKLLAEFGVELKYADPEGPWLGHPRWIEKDGQLIVGSYSSAGSPFYQAGIEKDDIIVKIKGREIKNKEDYQKALNKLKPGKKVEIEFMRHGQRQEAEVKVQQDPSLQLVFGDEAKLPEALRQRRRQWLQSKSR